MRIDIRVDMYPTDTYQGFKLRPGFFMRRGSSLVPGGINFSIYSSRAKSCELVLYHIGEKEPFGIIPFPESYRIGNVFSMIVFDLDHENIEYGFRVDGEYVPSRGDIFDKTKVLLDPYAKLVSGREVWGREPDWSNQFQYRSRIEVDNFDWEGDRPLQTPHNELIIYEAHVRGFTRDESSGVEHPGTYEGLKEKIPYLKDLGITAIELLPVFEFDEFEDAQNPHHFGPDGKPLLNYWGYSTVSFFAPKAGYAVSGARAGQVNELKSLIKELHKNGIKVILDVVFNHTAEGDEEGPYISFKGIDNRMFYILKPDGSYYNFSGCGNTLNCNHPTVRNMIVDCLRYWVGEYHIDGFRFDLASILGRDPEGNPLHNPPLLELLAAAPLLADCILIAEAWDAGGLYQVGTFPSYKRWSEWNGRYRDDMRCFLKGDAGHIEAAVARLTGSEDIYNRYWRGDYASINFITCHDGFTLFDLYSYNEKHNLANGWNNNDGANENHTWNCGCEGETSDPQINELRHRLMKNAAAVLLISMGVPMILAGDEFGNTQFGNNNPYCQDNKTSWLDWNRMEEFADVHEFFRGMIWFRRKHPVLMRESIGEIPGYPLLSVHGVNAWHFDRSADSRVVGVMFAGMLEGGVEDFVYIGINTHWEAHSVWLPQLPPDKQWKMVANTSLGDKAWFKTPEPLDTINHPVLLGARSVVVCYGAKF